MKLPAVLARASQDTHDAIVEEARADFLAARDRRRDREDRALKDYALYKRQRRDAEAERVARGGFSKIEVPIVFWNVEHQIPRLGVQPPTITVNAMSPEAVPYAEAKRMRLQHFLDVCGWDIPYQMVQKWKLIVGDGIAKTSWDVSCHHPRFTDVDWFDFWVSAEASRFETAEVHFHRTYLTRRMIERMRGLRDAKDRPLYANLDDLNADQTREQIDDTLGSRVDWAHEGAGVMGERQLAGVTQAVECWYSTGEVVTLAGPDLRTCIRATMSPIRKRDAQGEWQYLRPFSFFRNIMDLTGPYSMSVAEVLEHHQVELSTIRNAWIDQITLNINAPIMHDETISGAKVEEAFSRPRGILAVPWGPSGPPILRMPPGQASGDFPQMYGMAREEAEMISGLNDNAAGQATNGEQTATEVSILANEANWRMKLLRRNDEIAMGDVARKFDCLDRSFGGVVSLPVDGGTNPDELGGILKAPDSPEGLMSMMAGRGTPQSYRQGNVVRIGNEVNHPAAEYAIEIDAGSTTRPDQMEEAQKVATLVNALAPFQDMVDRTELARQVITSLGYSPDKILAPAPPTPPVGAPQPGGEVAGPPQPGEVPVGPAQPV